MDVLISLSIPSGDGDNTETYVVCEDMPTSSPQSSIHLALEMLDGALWHSDIRGVRNVGSNPAAAPLLPGEKYLAGGMQAAVALLRKRDPSRLPTGARY